MLRFIFGASGAGKSRTVYDEFISRSIEETGRNFLIIVPDQFTMQTQLDIIKLHPRHGIMNIDVLSFSRLSHRIFEEVGEIKTGVLDDMGKSLVLRHVAEKLKDELPVIGGNMHKMGYIDEVKSTISEFMQYRIEPGDLDRLLDASKQRGALRSKLLDLQRLYSGFKEYISGSFIAQEETMDILCRALPKSSLIPGSVIVFDGFTGFTPIQYQVIGVLLALADEVVFTCTVGQGENPYEYDKNKEQELFLISKKTVHDLLHLEYENTKNNDPLNTPDFERWAEYRNTNSKDIFVANEGKRRHALNPELSFLERNIFRYRKEVYDSKISNILLMEAEDIQSEVRMAFSKIRELVRSDEKLHYRDFAIVCGDIERYASKAELVAKEMDIPIYLDRTGEIGLNPFIEYIRGGLSVVNCAFSYESVFHYLRSGAVDFELRDVDELENYVRALGIRGKSAWEKPFSKLPDEIKRKLRKSDDPQKASELYLNRINALRDKVIKSLEMLFSTKAGTVRDYSYAIYEFITAGNQADKLMEREQFFRRSGDQIKAREYEAIYKKVIDLLEQITALMGDETITWKEYADILEVGFGDIEIGTIPASVDRILVGDIERTRLKEIKILFFLGATDDLIPKGTGTGGIISDIERQFLIDSEAGIEMAPTPRQQMYMQRLYLYMNLTKPSEKLYLSFSHLGPDGKSIRPAYLIGMIKSFFPAIETKRYSEYSVKDKLQTRDNGLGFIAQNIQSYALGYKDPDEEADFRALFSSLWNQGDEYKKRLGDMLAAAGMNYTHHPLSEAVATMLYGNVLINSVSRLEKFAQCSYSHFLRYGLGLGEREEYSFEYSDMGNVFHGVLETFSKNLEEKGLSWTTFTKEQGEEILTEAFDSFADSYGSDILSSTSRNISAKSRIKRILLRSIDTLSYQLKKGSFMPKTMEADFSSVGEIDAINVSLSEDEKGRILKRMRLTGRIDRIDTYEDSDHVYVKVIDFKSGDKKFDLCALYYGLQLQLVMYMNVARSMEKAQNPAKEVIPAAVLYYHLDDPVIDAENVKDAGESVDVNDIIRKKLRPNGVIASERDIVDLLDHEPGKESDVIPVKFNKDGSFSKTSGVMPPEEFEEISGYVSRLIKQKGSSIVAGDIEISPYQRKNQSACDYCSFKAICGFDPAISGYKKKILEELDEDEIMNRIRTEG